MKSLRRGRTERNEFVFTSLPENNFVVLGQALLLEAVDAAQPEVLVVPPVQENAVGAHRHEQEQQHQDLRDAPASERTRRRSAEHARNIYFEVHVCYDTMCTRGTAVASADAKRSREWEREDRAKQRTG